MCGKKYVLLNYCFNVENKINRNAFEFLYVIGKGGFGKVWKIKHKITQRIYACKEMNKTKIIDKNLEKNIMIERELLAKLKFKFIVNMHYAFQDYYKLYLIMDLLSGGDLRYMIGKHRRFSEEQTSKLY